MNRRDLLKMIAAATGMAMVGGELWAAGMKSPDAGKTLYTADDVAMLDEIAEHHSAANQQPWCESGRLWCCDGRAGQ